MNNSNKISKCGIKIVMLCDVGTKYVIDAHPCLGKGAHPRSYETLADFVNRRVDKIHLRHKQEHRIRQLDHFYTNSLKNI